MSKELKDLIDTIDSSNRAHSEISKMIAFLKNEVERLTFTIKEQKEVIQNQSVKLSSLEENNLPRDIIVLKEMVVNQREELIKKDKDIEILKKTLEEVTVELENSKQFNEENEELIYAQKTIVQLTEEKEILKRKLDKLQRIIASRNDEDLIDRDQQLIDAKKLLFQLTEENGIKSVKIESLKAENEDLTLKLEQVSHLNQELSKNIALATQSKEDVERQLIETQKKIEYLGEKLEIISNQRVDWVDDAQYQDEEVYLKENNANLHEENSNLKNIIHTNTSVIENLEQRCEKLSKELQENEAILEGKELQNEKKVEELNQKLKKIENANEQLNGLINELRKKEKEAKIPEKQAISLIGELDRNIPPSLFRIMYDRLEEDNKLMIKDFLISDLHSGSREARTYAIKTLSSIRSKEILNELKSIKSDDDWIVKLYLIKALSLFDKEDIKDTLKELTKDKDLDVRESADKLLSRINCN